MTCSISDMRAIRYGLRQTECSVRGSAGAAEAHEPIMVGGAIAEAAGGAQARGVVEPGAAADSPLETERRAYGIPVDPRAVVALAVRVGAPLRHVPPRVVDAEAVGRESPHRRRMDVSVVVSRDDPQVRVAALQ